MVVMSTSHAPDPEPLFDPPGVESLVTEDDTPVDGLLPEKQMRLLTEPLYTSFSAPDGRPFLAATNVGLFHALRQPPLVPDVLLALDVEVPVDLAPKQNRSYFVWEYGKVPDVVIEIVSNREGGEDTTKLRGYARIHVPYYAVFDPLHLLSSEAQKRWANEPDHQRMIDQAISRAKQLVRA